MRRTAREIAFMLIYEEQFNKNRDVEFSFNFLKSEQEVLHDHILDLEDESYIKKILECYSNHKIELEEKLNNNVHGYESDRIYKVDKALLLLAIIEIFYIKTPAAIVINEVVEIAKIYSTDKSVKYINGVLGGIIKKSPN